MGKQPILRISFCGLFPKVFTDTEGDYVRYIDHAQTVEELKSEIQRVTKHKEAFEERLVSMTADRDSYKNSYYGGIKETNDRYAQLRKIHSRIAPAFWWFGTLVSAVTYLVILNHYS